MTPHLTGATCRRRAMTQDVKTIRLVLSAEQLAASWLRLAPWLTFAVAAVFPPAFRAHHQPWEYLYQTFRVPQHLLLLCPQ